MKKLLFTLVAGFILIPAFSQLSTRENDAAVIKLGTRPVAGDFSLTFGLPLTSGSTADLSIINSLQSGDFITFKTYLSSSLAFRAGIKLYKDSESASGDLIDLVTDTDNGSFEYKENNREYIIAPGIEKHFNASNIFDVYTGIDLFVGFGKYTEIQNETYANDDYDNYKLSSTNLVLGVGPVIGVSMFVAQLPVSIGLEYGVNIKYSTEGKDHYETETKVGGTTSSQDYYTSDRIPGTYSKLKQSSMGINTNENVRIVLNIYFGN